MLSSMTQRRKEARYSSSVSFLGPQGQSQGGQQVGVHLAGVPAGAAAKSDSVVMSAGKSLLQLLPFNDV